MTAIAYFKQLLVEARTKVTTYLAAGVVGFSQLADHAQDLHDDFPRLMGYLPQGPLITKGAHYAVTALGFLIVWSRVRRYIGPAKTAG